MGILDRIKSLVSAASSGDQKVNQSGLPPTEFSSWDDLRDQLGLSSGGGNVVNPHSARRASAVYACVELLAGLISTLPIQVKDRRDNKVATDHPVSHLLNRESSPLETAAVYRHNCQLDTLLTGDSISLIERNRKNEPVGLYHVDARSISVERDGSRRKYLVPLGGGASETFLQADVLHSPYSSFKSDHRGRSPIQECAAVVGLTLSGQEYAKTFFENGGNIGSVLEFEGKMTDSQKSEVKEYWARKHIGLANSHKPAVLTEGGKYKSISLSAEDAQLLETRQFQVVEIARIYGIPPYLIASTEKTTSWGSGMEQQNMSFLTYRLVPTLSRQEQELNRKLFPKGDFYLDFDTGGLLRADQKSRHESYRIGRGGNQEPGYLTINEIREREGLSSITGGDTLFQPIAKDVANGSKV